MEDLMDKKKTIDTMEDCDRWGPEMIDPANATGLNTPVELTDATKMEWIEMFKRKMEHYVEEFFDFYMDKGRKMEVSVVITKENNKSTHSEGYVYGEDQEVKLFWIVQIGNKDKEEIQDQEIEKE